METNKKMKKSYKLISTDLDGTLVYGQKGIDLFRKNVGEK